MKKSTFSTVVAAGAAAALVLAACSGAETSPESVQPQSGGDLRIGMPANPSESLDPHYTNAASSDLLRSAQLFDGLTTRTPEGEIEMSLATKMEPNAESDVWTVSLREGVSFHDGTEFTADDVIFSINRILNPDETARGAGQISFLKPEMIEKVDDQTLRFNLDEPYGPFEQVWSSNYLPIVPEEFDVQKPVGTGPFSYVSFTPGQESTFARNNAYWAGPPLLDTVHVQGFADTDAAINALISGQIDVAYSVPLNQVDVLKSTPGLELLESETGQYLPIVMRTDIKPFDDERVRLAMKLIADRQELVNNALNGSGRIANDWIAGYGHCPQPSIQQREQDIAEAKRLLAEAGQSGLSIELTTTGGTSGMIDSAVVFAEQAKEAGVNITVKQLDEASYLAKYTEWPMAVDFYGSPYLELIPLTLLPDGPGNAGRWNDEEFNDLAEQLYKTSDADEQCQVIDQMKEIEHVRGPNIVWGWVNVLNAHKDTVRGLVPDVEGKAPFNLNDVYIAE